MRMLRLALISLLWGASALANCVNLNGRSYCAQPGGQAVVHQGQAYCGAGACVSDEFGNLFCSPYPGGGVIRARGSFYAGPGLCVLGPDGAPHCAAAPGGGCEIGPGGQPVCAGGSTATPAARAQLCQ
ncbi:hypothetical protein DK842_03665 [Chromobacterium phragmitis]|uniref:Uncharacterized protein n=1 Tax=Chromobacterium phragmitis TaxID=2202141 RepID=A0A344UGQ2_9NEIS|nr:hypothetical protein [Chromobacterium phragmitis]AXE29090.1 hypothetical protein DK842_03665 [Chromobacterium phragmitis]AXE34450.1 hypothetical protein DK843_09150 [Chromobacterium phragmitis]